MNERTSRLALFRSVDAECATLATQLRRFVGEVVSVSSLEELGRFFNEQEASLDGIIVPLKLAGGGSGVTVSLQIRADETLTTIPLVALATTRDAAVVRSLYGAGADAVVFPPFDGEMIYLQVEALIRQRRSLDEHLSLLRENSGLKRSIYEAFNAVREGVLIFDTTGELIFLNGPARALLGVEAVPLSELHSLATQFYSHLEHHHEHEVSGTPVSESRAQIVRGDGRAIKLGLRITTILGSDESPAGIAVALTDLNQIAHLGELIAQDHRTRSLALLSGAGNLRLLAQLGGHPHSVLPQIESHLAEAPARCHIAPTITALLEIIDPALNPGARVKVNLTTDAVVAVPVSEVFQLAGHIILHSVARAGNGGETTIGAAFKGNRLELQIVSELSAQVVTGGRDTVSRLIHGSWSERASHRTVDGTPLVDFEAARGIAHKNGLTLKERPLEGGRIAYIVSMPLSGVD